MEGWISIHRKIQENWLWKDKPFSKGQAWIDLLMECNHKGNKFNVGNELIELERGQKVWSIKDMADKWGWSRKKVSSFLNILAKDGMLAQKRTSKYTLITIENYSTYQNQEQQKNIKSTSEEHQKHTNNNVNNDNTKYIDDFFEECWSFYPNKKGKGKISTSKKKEVYKLDKEFIRCIERYTADVESKRKNGFKELKYQNGSTFFNSGYVDYLDENFESDKKKESLKPVRSIEERLKIRNSI